MKSSDGKLTGEFQQFFQLGFSEKGLGITDGGERRNSQGIHGGDFRPLHDRLAQGADEHELGGGELGMLAHPFIEGLGDGFLTDGKLGDLEDVTQEIGEGAAWADGRPRGAVPR
jgi:hypothetical protein